MTLDQLIECVAKGDAEVSGFLRAVVAIAHTWDDLIDRDKHVAPSELSAAMWLALIDLPANPFYQRNFRELRAVLANSVLNWRIATNMERSGDGGLDIAYILRSSYADLMTHCALIVGGVEHAVVVGELVRRETHHEGLEAYTKALAVEAAERERSMSNVR